MLLDLHFGLLLHVVHDAGAGDFALEAGEDEANAVADVETLEHLFFVGDAQVHIRGREIGEASGIGHIHFKDLRHFIRDAVNQFG